MSRKQVLIDYKQKKECIFTKHLDCYVQYTLNYLLHVDSIIIETFFHSWTQNAVYLHKQFPPISLNYMLTASFISLKYAFSLQIVFHPAVVWHLHLITGDNTAQEESSLAFYIVIKSQHFSHFSYFVLLIVPLETSTYTIFDSSES